MPIASSPTHQKCWSAPESQSTIWVGSGSSPPKSVNILAKVGMMKISMKAVAPRATVSTTPGYTMALWTLRFSASAFSM